MKKAFKVFMLLLVLALNSCGINKAWIFNQNQNTTQVHLSKNNFKVVGEVQGNASAGYVLFFGGAQKKQLYAAAYGKMLENADLPGGCRALINVLTEEHIGGVPPFYYQRTVSFTAQVIEFID